MQALQAAFRAQGYQLDVDGRVYPLQLEALEGKPVTDALWAYVKRVRLGAWDPAVV